MSRVHVTITLLKFNSSPEKIGLTKRKLIFQPSIFYIKLRGSRNATDDLVLATLLGFALHLRCLEKVTQTYDPKWWFDGDLPMVKHVKKHPKNKSKLIFTLQLLRSITNYHTFPTKKKSTIHGSLKKYQLQAKSVVNLRILADNSSSVMERRKKLSEHAYTNCPDVGGKSVNVSSKESDNTSFSERFRSCSFDFLHFPK